MKSDKALKNFAKSVLTADETLTNSQLVNVCKSQFSDVPSDVFYVTICRAIWYVNHHNNQCRDYRF